MHILIVNDVSDRLRALNNLLSGMVVRPVPKDGETESPMRILIVDHVPENIRLETC